MACSPGHAMCWPRVAMGSIPCWKGREGGVCTRPFTHGVGTVHEATQRGSLSRVVQTCLAPLLAVRRGSGPLLLRAGTTFEK